MLIISCDTETFWQLIFWYIQKQSPTSVLQAKCSSKYWKLPPVLVSFLIKLQVWGLRPMIHEKKTLALVFSCEFCKIFKNTYFVEHLRRLFLHIIEIFMTTNFFYCNYDVINFFNTWIKRICIEKLELPFRISFLYFLSYLVSCMYLFIFISLV